MKTTVTSRHFKAHETLVEYAEAAVEKLERYYDGILKCEVKLSFEKARNSVKVAEVILSVYRSKITALQTSDDFNKYKEKLHEKDRMQVRRVREKA
jgi:putative sigma-54 modulation protein